MYGIAYIGETDLPEAQDFVVIETREGDVFVLMKPGAIRRDALADAWAAVRRLDDLPPEDTPRPSSDELRAALELAQVGRA